MGFILYILIGILLIMGVFVGFEYLFPPKHIGSNRRLHIMMTILFSFLIFNAVDLYLAGNATTYLTTVNYSKEFHYGNIKLSYPTKVKVYKYYSIETDPVFHFKLKSIDKIVVRNSKDELLGEIN